MKLVAAELPLTFNLVSQSTQLPPHALTLGKPTSSINTAPEDWTTGREPPVSWILSCRNPGKTLSLLSSPAQFRDCLGPGTKSSTD